MENEIRTLTDELNVIVASYYQNKDMDYEEFVSHVAAIASRLDLAAPKKLTVMTTLELKAYMVIQKKRLPRHQDKEIFFEFKKVEAIGGGAYMVIDSNGFSQGVYTADDRWNVEY